MNVEKLLCLGCGRSGGVVDRLIAGPAVYICDVCVQTAGEILDSPSSEVAQGWRRVVEAGARCSFCGRTSPVATPKAGGGICSDCVRICREILAQNRKLGAESV